MKIAIASSGLGHVARGVETWAGDTAVALEEFRSSIGSDDHSPNTNPCNLSTVTLFSAAPLQPITHHSSLLTIRVLPCLKRGDTLAKLISRFAPGFMWRWGWKSAYDLEQKSFWKLLWPILRDEGYDILHVQDPLLADLCRQYREKGKIRTKEILAHGTEETPEFLAKFPYVQHLAPWHLEQTLKALGEEF